MLLYMGGEEKKSKKAEKKRDKQSLAALPLHPSISLSLSLLSFSSLYLCGEKIKKKEEKKRNLSFHHQIQADLYVSGAKQTNIIFSVSRL